MTIPRSSNIGNAPVFLPPGGKEIISEPDRKTAGQEGSLTKAQDILPFRKLNGAELSAFILRRLLTARFPTPSHEILTRLNTFLSGSPFSQYLPRLALALQCEEKKLILSPEQFHALYKVLDESSEPFPEEKEAAIESPEDPLFLSEQNTGREKYLLSDIVDQFNRKKNGKHTWVLFPFDCTIERYRYHACLRLNFPEGETSPGKAILSVRNKETNFSWFFVWFPGNTEIPLQIYFPDSETGKPVPISPKLLHTFGKKLRKIGLRLDDKLNKRYVFDGFEEVDVSLQTIDRWV